VVKGGGGWGVWKRGFPLVKPRPYWDNPNPNPLKVWPRNFCSVVYRYLHLVAANGLRGVFWRAVGQGGQRAFAQNQSSSLNALHRALSDKQLCCIFWPAFFLLQAHISKTWHTMRSVLLLIINLRNFIVLHWEKGEDW